MRLNSSVFTIALILLGMHGCKPVEPSTDENPREQVEIGSFSEIFDACASDDFYLRQDLTKLNPVYDQIDSMDIIPIPSKVYLSALKVLDSKTIKKIENTKLFGVNVGQRSGQPYLVRACLDADFRKYFSLPKPPSLQRRLEGSKIGWNIVRNQNTLLYQQSVMARSDKLSPAIFIVWSDEEISAVKGMIYAHH